MNTNEDSTISNINSALDEAARLRDSIREDTNTCDAINMLNEALGFVNQAITDITATLEVLEDIAQSQTPAITT